MLKERKKSFDDDSLLEAFEHFKDMGYIHKEADRWHHIGSRSLGSGKRNLCFLDLGPNGIKKVYDDKRLKNGYPSL